MIIYDNHQFLWKSWNMFPRIDYIGKHQILFLTGFNFLCKFWVTESETGFLFSLLVRFPKILDFKYFDEKHTIFIKNIHRTVMKRNFLDIFEEEITW